MQGSDSSFDMTIKTNKMKATVTISETEFRTEHADLIQGCKRGDQKAQFRIYKLYYKAMYNISLRIVNDPMEAEDIMQESFLAAFEEIGSYSGTVSFGAWLKRIVRNRSIDFFRKNSRFALEGIEAMEELYDEYPDRLTEEETGFRMNVVKETLTKLPEKCRNIFSLYFLEGYDHEEISEILSISESTSRSQLSRAKYKIRRLLDHNTAPPLKKSLQQIPCYFP